MNNRPGDWIYTRSGRQFWFLDPRPDEIDIGDIAHALSHVCRFAGHTPDFYSVAEHSVLVSLLCEQFTADKHLAMYGLMHDASEAYMCDIPRPLKNVPPMHGYKLIEDLVQSVIYKKHGLTLPEPKELKLYDYVMCQIERREFFNHFRDDKPGPDAEERAVIDATAIRPIPLSPTAARELFLDRYAKLTFGYRHANCT